MELLLTIEKLVNGGYGLCRTDKGIVFVSGGLPGETVRAAIGPKIGGLPYAECTEVLKPSTFRRSPPCPLAGVCGGCDWLHIAYGHQVSIKEGIFRECLERTGKIKTAVSIEIHTAAEFGYRRRVQVKIDRAQRSAGFFRKRTNTIVPVTQCPLLCEDLNKLLTDLQLHIELLPENTEQVKAIAGTHPGAGADCAVLPTVASSPVVSGITGASAVIDVEGRHFSVSGESFFQSNRFLCGACGLCAAEWLSGNTFWDLYGGAGFFSVFVAPLFSSGTLVDNEQKHVADCASTFLANGISNVKACQQIADDFVRDAEKSGSTPDCIIIDPPRSGLGKTVRTGIAHLQPSSILYISCDPATQARDAGFFINHHGYRLAKAALFDFYPQTHHLETVLLLRK
jgi:23S rRNA (uracil1939-C5)-methyltransferase